MKITQRISVSFHSLALQEFYIQKKHWLWKWKHRQVSIETSTTHCITPSPRLGRIFPGQMLDNRPTCSCVKEKGAMDMNMQFREQEAQITSKHLRRYSNSLAVREIQINTMSYCFMHTHRASMRKRVKIYSGQEWGKSSPITGGNMKCLWKARHLLKLKIHILCNPEAPFLQFCLIKMKASVSKDRCSRMLVTAFFQRQKGTGNSKCASAGVYLWS